MNKKELYKMALRAKNRLDPEANKVCSNCFSAEVKLELDKAHIFDNTFFSYCGSICSNPLFYLEDQGIIKILEGVPDRSCGVDCANLKVKILPPFEVNKI